MSSTPPTAPLSLPISTTTPPPPPSAPLSLDPTVGISTTPASAPTSAAAVYTPAEMTGVLNELVTAVQGIRLFLASPYGTPSHPQPSAAAGHPALPWYPPYAASPGAFQPPPAYSMPWTPGPFPALAAPSTAAAYMPPSQPLPLQAPPPLHSGPPPPASRGVPIQHVRFPASPSPLPAWLSGSSPPPVYTTAGDPPLPTLPSPTAAGFARPLKDRTGAPGHAASPPPPPRYAKVDFATFDGSEDPLNWLSQCEQFFRGQRTLMDKSLH